ncbi:MAG: rod shape-determining protein [Candidatus Liptonbacteria bacterium RIFOXYC1_FULL_36_8]|uniref:Cell shape-determining protein MreB n=3 Tax=Candidatus Liptoniibacteriota TaxID=1817909 RepID=A0A1G2CKS6_9BACT|nr:MAG: rod shape-determining protein [Candidatus Liptonbacteria bacterium RIFOXYB1_FULL_36_10]OGZ04056.1 MAG: rod shape-determining protein [Candidatus Liptonbacteria bacterium RIFOXYC1_FULL_36_8]OGZ04233.1 MAG: rod shape-determining protein [Candidatus Liptonbacteria bacterium RIFOXYD1_FULL_36_11]
MFITKIGIDLGTANTVVFVPGKGFIINEPTIVALTKPENRILAVGREAKEMIGRAPDDIIPYRPLKDGVIADYYITKAMLSYFISKAAGRFHLIKPEVVISVPAGITQTERRAVINAAKEAGAKEVYVVREPILAALGAGIPINSYSGNMIINIGGGTAEVAVVSLGGIVSWKSLRVAGNKFDQVLMDYIKKKHSLSIGEQMAETVKISIGSALPSKQKLEFQLRGLDLISGLPKDLIINSNEVAEAISPLLNDIAAAVQDVFNSTPPELVADIMDKGIILSGGGALLRNLDEFFERIIGVPSYQAEEPLFCVARGTGIILNHLDTYKRTLLNKK